MRGGEQPAAVAAAEVLLQEAGVGLRQFADAVDAQRGQPLAGLGADAVDPARRQWPDAPHEVVGAEQRQAVRLVEVGADLRQQLVGRDADRTRQAGGRAYRVLDALREGRRVVGKGAEVDVDFVDAAVFDLRRELRNRGLEEP